MFKRFSRFKISAGTIIITIYSIFTIEMLKKAASGKFGFSVSNSPSTSSVVIFISFLNLYSEGVFTAREATLSSSPADFGSDIVFFLLFVGTSLATS